MKPKTAFVLVISAFIGGGAVDHLLEAEASFLWLLTATVSMVAVGVSLALLVERE